MAPIKGNKKKLAESIVWSTLTLGAIPYSCFGFYNDDNYLGLTMALGSVYCIGSSLRAYKKYKEGEDLEEQLNEK